MNPQDKARTGLSLMKEAVLDLLAVHKDGLTNAAVERQLDIRSDYMGGAKSYLSWSILGLLLNEGRIRRNGKKYYPPEDIATTEKAK